MTTLYPSALDTTTQLKNDANDATVTESIHAEAHNNEADAIIAIETELGINPSGTYTDVASFLAALQAGTVKLSPTATQIITPTGDTVALVVKLQNALNVSNLFEARLADDSIVAFIDRHGNLSAQSFEVNGAAPTGTGVLVMSNGPTIASPTLTGTPTAPTPAAGDSSTKIATTAFVNESGVPIGAAMDWPYAAASIPSWSALAYGQPISRTTYAALNTIAADAGYPHGAGDGSTTFNLPDYRGRTGVGMDNMGGTAANRITLAISGINGASLGATGGAEGITLTTAQIPAHNHSVTGSPGFSDPGHTHNPLFSPGGGSVTSLGQSAGSSASYGSTQNNAGQDFLQPSGTGITVSAGTLGTANAGGGSAHANVQPTIIVNKIIRIQ